MTGSVDSLPFGLRDTQQLLFDAVTIADESGQSGAAAQLSELIAANGLGALRRVAIYRSAYRARLVECLADDYPATQYLLGHAAFAGLCREYIHEVPPGVTLNDYGARFAEYCLQHAPEHASLASELAQLEWALVTAVHQSDARKLAPAELAALTPADWDSASLLPSPTLTLVATRYPVNGFLQAFRDDRAPPPPSPAPSWVVVCRDGIDVWRIELLPELAPLFARLVAGEPLAAALASMSSSAPDADAVETESMIQQAFSQWMRAGCFSGIRRTSSG